MNKLYSWSMRNSAQILFGLAIFIFLVGLAQAFMELGNTPAEVSLEGEPVGQRALGLLMAVAGTIHAATASVMPLAAAAALYRWDRNTKR